MIFLMLFSTSFVNNIYSQNEFKPSKTQFMIRGYGHSGLDYTKSGTEEESSYVGTVFAPIFLFKLSDRLMFEAELEFELEGGETKVGYEYADVMYILNDYMTVRAGKFLLPFGTFMERLHPAWINKLGSRPLGFGHDGIAPSSGVGIELRGAFQVGYSKFNYAVYSTNGPTINNGLGDHPDEAGMLGFENFEDNNNSKAYGGRLGFLPFNNSALEIGGSFYSGIAGNKDDSLYSDVGSLLLAADLSYVKQIPQIKGIIDVKAQYTNSNVDKATYVATDGDTIAFENTSNGFYAQLAYRPSMVGNKYLKNIELVGRYSVLNTPEGAEWESEQTQMAFGLNYWLSWRSVLKLTYQTTEVSGGHGAPAGSKNEITGFFAHWGLGF